ncbi:hypothetical protein FY528_11075 [Hymenobacter lutimineralis]|uniref:Apolipoprotein N-acyltransferase n=1 Tax=Hymenobacter lutimineralis TaxID=2606448 RepID=A0A5D6V2M2_9BACT|nr:MULTISPECIES: hypothetical protein [Hymenobacter]QIX61733.1 hypothetical protein HER32_11320 [Hymenobacter sp. BT18]TYZ09278.1 hypothetical protein FY528_11075 [Hymenobacter lutimineralis]
MLLFLLIFLAATGAQLFLPWWSVVPVAVALGFWRGTRSGRAFLAGFAGLALSWLLPAAWLHLRTDGILSQRVATLLPLGGNGWLLALVAALLIGLIGGLSSLSGYWLRRAIWNGPPAPVSGAARRQP